MSAEVERQAMQVDIACVGFGPAMGGFLTTLSRAMSSEQDAASLQSRTAPGLPLQVVCYERADDVGFGVSGVVTRGRAIRQSFPELDLESIPLACDVTQEKLVYLMDPHGASRRSASLRAIDSVLRGLKKLLPGKAYAYELPYIPPFMRKEGGVALSMGQFNQWVSNQLMASGLVQIWPGTPVEQALFADDESVVGVRLVDQGVSKSGEPASNFMPGMDINSALTVVGDGPVGAVGQQLSKRFGLPVGHHQRDWAVGMKVVVELPESCSWTEGTVLHTFGYPEPEIFGFLYVYPNRVASLGIFVPSWFRSPVRTAYRYLQHWMMHPYIWPNLKGGSLRSWGAKTLQESGVRGEPYLVGDGYARIGEGSGSTNVLSGSGVDEAWLTGVLLAEGVIELCREDKPFSEENLQKAYIGRRRKSWLEREARIATKARDGFQRGFLYGLLGMGITGLTNGRINLPAASKPPHEQITPLEEYFKGKLSSSELDQIKKECADAATPLHDEVMNRCGWPEIPYDGSLLVSHQDALLMGGKVQAMEGFADHVVFVHPHLCRECVTRVCIEGCSGQAIMPGENGEEPQFDREKCVHCGACLWNCAKAREGDPERCNIEFRAGSGGLHSAEN